jgi:hypothetical protein
VDARQVAAGEALDDGSSAPHAVCVCVCVCVCECVCV